MTVKIMVDPNNDSDSLLTFIATGDNLMFQIFPGPTYTDVIKQYTD